MKIENNAIIQVCYRTIEKSYYECLHIYLLKVMCDIDEYSVLIFKSWFFVILCFILKETVIYFSFWYTWLFVHLSSLHIYKPARYIGFLLREIRLSIHFFILFFDSLLVFLMTSADVITGMWRQNYVIWIGSFIVPSHHRVMKRWCDNSITMAQ